MLIDLGSHSHAAQGVAREVPKTPEDFRLNSTDPGVLGLHSS